MAAVLPALIGGALAGGGALLGSRAARVRPPPPRDYGAEGRNTLADQIALAPQLFAAEQQFRPQYAQLDLDILRQTLPGTLDLERQATSFQRAGDIGDVEALGGRARDAFRAANPQLAEIQDALTRRAMEGGDSALMGELRTQAMAGLQEGGRLTAGEERDVQQSARAAFNARGLARSDPGIFSEALERDRFARGRQAQRRQFAQGVDSQSLQREQYGSNLMGTTGQFLSQTSSDPFMAILGRSAAPQGLAGAGFSLQSQPQIFNPYDPYAGGIYASNQQNIMDARTATAANRAGLAGALIGAGGAAAGGWLGRPCWVARSAYGAANPRWLDFRAWLLGRAPGWLRKCYLKHGERWAAWLDAHAWAKPAVRALMNTILLKADGVFPLMTRIKARMRRWMVPNPRASA